MKKEYEDLFFTDDFMFCKVMKNPSICARVIKTLTGLDVAEVIYPNRQEDIKPDFRAHGIRLDIRVRGSDKMFDIEMQPRGGKNLPKRARYYQALMDMDFLDEGHAYSELQDSFIVFISLEDPFGLGFPRYTVRQICEENTAASETIADKTKKIFYNASAWNKLSDADAQNFLRFLLTKKPQDSLTEDIMDAVNTARHNEPWRIEFLHMRELKQEGREEQKAEDQKIIDAKDAEIAAKSAEIERLKALLAAGK